MNHITENLDKLFAILIDRNLPVVNNLQAPLSKAEIEQKVEGLPLRLHEDLYTLYQWRNGIIDSWEGYLGANWLFPGSGFFSLNRAVEVYHEFAGKDEFWNMSKFMVFESGGGDALIMECDPSSAEYGMVFQYDISSADFEVMTTIYDSFLTLLRTVIECYKENLYVSDKIYGVNRSKYEIVLLEADISKRLNPKSNYWRSF